MASSDDVGLSQSGIKCRRCGGSSLSSWDLFLPITRRGSFFQDSFFSNIHHDFDAAIREVLGRWNEPDLKVTDSRDDVSRRYRRLRSQNMNEESQAVTVTSDNTGHKIVLDVHDFVEGDVKVNLIDEQQLVVEGRMEKKEGNSSSSNTFRRIFTLPGDTDMTAIMPVISADGILTITAPKMEQKSTSIPVSLQQTQTISSSASGEASLQGSETSEKECQCLRCSLKNIYDKRTSQTADDAMSSARSQSIDAQVIQNSSASSGAQEQMQSKQVFGVTEPKTAESVSSESSSSMRKKNQADTDSRRIRRDSWDVFFPITQRGSFFQDSFFSDIHDDFDIAVRKALSRWNNTDRRVEKELHQSDVLDRYRQLRPRDLKEENLAITVTSDTTSHKIALDVHGFVVGELKVKAEGDYELVVEGRLEKGEEGASATFKQRFTLPETSDMSNVSAVMSSDGILTITAPKKQRTKIIPIEVEEEAQSAELLSASVSMPNVPLSSMTSSSKSFVSQAVVEDSETIRRQEGVKIPINEESVASHEEGQMLCQNVTKVPTSAVSESRKVVISGSDIGEASEEASVSKKSHLSFESQSTRDKAGEICLSGNRLPIVKRGLFFDDSFFQDTRRDFQKAIKEVLVRSGEESSDVDEMACYRSLRSRHLGDDTQAVTSSEDERYHKFILDVQDFVDGEVNVEAVSDRELVVEGRVEKEEGGSKSTKRFLRRFLVPGHFNLEGVDSSLSSDGVLTITVPKMKIGGSLSHESHVSALSKSSLESVGQDHTNVLTTMKNIKEQIIPLDVEDSDGLSISREREAIANFGSSSMRVSQEAQRAGYPAPSEDEDMFIAVVKQPDYHYKVVAQEGEGAEMLGDGHLDIQATQQTRTALGRESKSVGTVGISSGSGYLPIIRKGPFDSDYFFENVRENYSQAVREVLEKAKEWSCRSDAIQNYRSLRQRNLRLDNQAVNVSEDQHSHKVVMDVHDFTGGDVTVQLAEGKELLVEGQAERQEENRVSRLSFVRCFPLPDHVDRDSITTALSSDGILTIITMKK
ncbi:uncharacterized protein LOC125029066 isoform X2 [Penaeus chinensis]|uniref:uncharacterized protein LOC125029066 isoform X2 n=1 Tax=Penaeus chinensis TaxID=139456 RepID=UPI001FB714E3|nr:uncharacterized protein LOC125029066 isoform X2 [Penaeus chinensis]